jgi:uncharacterized spore protein YtfJ
MDADEVITQARDALTVKRVFGEPYEKNGVTAVAVAAVRGGAGGEAARGRRARGRAPAVASA